MAELPPIAVVLTADTTDFTRGINKAERQVDAFSAPVKRAGSSLGALKFAAIGAAAVIAGKQVWDFASAAIDSAQQAQIADARLRQILESMGYVGEAYRGGAERLNEYSTALMKQIGVDDESIKAVQAKLLIFKSLGSTLMETGGMMDRATQAAFDLSATGLGSAEGAAMKLGKAMENPAKGLTALGRAGVVFTEKEKEKIKALVESNKVQQAQEIILSKVEQKVNGVAAATATSAQKAKIAYGEFQEAIGTALLPTVNKMFDTLGPMFDKLSGPISKLAAQIGDSLSKAFDALAPVLPVLIDAMTKLGGIVTELVVTAIKALIPVVTPILKLFSDLAGKIGPILAPLLEKIGQLFSAVVEAVSPLIEPLTKLVMDILDAAAPIIDLVVDVLISLVQALAPVLRVVSTLLDPITRLLNLGFKLIMPVLEPLLPLIDKLAVILGDVLTRAIGLLMTAAGNWITGFAKIAPFILTNVTKPVVEYFMTMAENVLEAAEKMLSWVPGLGPKIAEARAAFGELKTTVSKAITDAARTASVEGGKIGKELIDSGVALMKDPASQDKARTAGLGIGRNLTEGVRAGLLDKRSEVYDAAASVIFAAEKGSRAAAQSQSPSKLFAEIGRDLTDGLVAGVKDGGDKVREAFQQTYVDWFKKAVETLQEKLNDARDAFNSFKDEVADALKTGIDFGGAMTGVGDRAKAIADAEKALAEARDAAMAKDATESDKKAVTLAEQDLERARNAGSTLGLTFIDALTAQAQKAQEFAAKVQTLIEMKLSREALMQVLAAGNEAGTNIANELIAGGSDAITKTNDLVATTQAAADKVGLMAASNWEQTGVDSALATLKGFKDKFGKGGDGYKRMQDIMDKLADSMKRNTTITVTTIHRDVFETVGNVSNPSQRAIGGPVFSNVPYYVGERGPELFIPNGVSGTIVPNDRLTSGGQTINVYAETNADANVIAREVAWAVKVGV